MPQRIAADTTAVDLLELNSRVIAVRMLAPRSRPTSGCRLAESPHGIASQPFTAPALATQAQAGLTEDTAPDLQARLMPCSQNVNKSSDYLHAFCIAEANPGANGRVGGRQMDETGSA